MKKNQPIQNKLLIVSLFVFFQCTFASNIATSNEVVFNIARLNNTNSTQQYEKYIISAYQSLGYQVSFPRSPSNNTLKETNEGLYDAELIRTTLIEAMYPNLIRVPVELDQINIVLFCLASLPCDINVLNNASNIIGMTDDLVALNQFMKTKKAQIYQVDNNQSLSKMLNKGRIQYILTLSNSQNINTAELSHTQYKMLTLKTLKSYHYIHKKYKALIPRLTKALKIAMAKNVTDK